MKRVPKRAWLGVGLAAAVLSYVGCSSSNSTNSGPGAVATSSKAPTTGPGAPKADSPASDREKSTKLPANWPNPAAVLVVSGEMDGYLEPCGCTQGQLGGLIRRLDFVDRLRAQNWPVALIDLGSLIKDPAAARGGFEQAKIKFGVALKAYSDPQVRRHRPDAEDLKVGIGEAFAQFLNNLGDSTKIVVANVQPGGGLRVADSCPARSSRSVR